MLPAWRTIARTFLLWGFGGVFLIPANPISSTRNASSVRLSIRDDFLVIAEAQFGDSRQRGNVIVDTGTVPSIVDTRIAREFGRQASSASVAVVGNLVQTQTVILPELNLGSIRVSSLPVYVQDLSSWERKTGMPIAGIIGMDVLGQTSFRLDYRAKRLNFGNVNQHGIAATMSAQMHVPIVTVQVEGHAVRLLVDTGTDRVVLLRTDPSTIAGLAMASTRQDGMGVTGAAIHAQVFYSPDIVLSGQHFRLARGYVVPGNSSDEFDGLLGVRALGFQAIAYNRELETMYLQK